MLQQLLLQCVLDAVAIANLNCFALLDQHGIEPDLFGSVGLGLGFLFGFWFGSAARVCQAHSSHTNSTR